MERKLTRAECEEFLRQTKPLLDTIYDSMANLWEALNAWVDQILKDPKVRAALREHPDLKHLFNDA
jgi:hypothetical protein